jgi:PPK2 family polyphosphate:nucleotide phosphotransferase
MGYEERFRVSPGSQVRLGEIDPAFHGDEPKHEAKEALRRDRARLRELQTLLYAEDRRSLLVCLQGMDTAGKDGTINHVFSAMNLQGCRVVNFRQPSEVELAHDFLWRVHRNTPGRGEVVIFNRSHYEDVLVVRVHSLVPREVWTLCYDRINAFERGLADHDTLVLKFFLHISKEEQLQRFADRLDEPDKQWKLGATDYAERKRWDEYAAAYEEALSRCSTEHAPWYVIPADHKWFRNRAIARIVVERLEALGMTYPEPTVDLERTRRDYDAAKKE